MENTGKYPEVFVAAITDQCDLLYAPLHNFSALVNRGAARQLREILSTGQHPSSTAIQPIMEPLSKPAHTLPAIRTGPINKPFFIGLIPTRGCNLACRYCDFPAPGQDGIVMDLALIRNAVEAYLDLLLAHGHRQGEIHFFGGEPFHARAAVEAAVGYASLRASELGISLRFEATTNGVYNEFFCDWIADHFDAVVLSMDGPADIQNRHRPARKGLSHFSVVERSAKIFSEGPTELVIRACVTKETAPRMKEIARWMASEFRPAMICFEPLNPTANAEAAGLVPPDPWEFARNFHEAACLLDDKGIEVVYSSATLNEIRNSFCPVGRDALIVSPEGELSACYLIPSDWESKGLDLKIGYVSDKGFNFDPRAVQRVRQLAGREKPLCVNCLCQYHCAGGCHVNHTTDQGPYDDSCIQTRIITITKLLDGLSQPALASLWLNDRPQLETTIRQKTDRLLSPELPL
jgi:uncharacterized protein